MVSVLCSLPHLTSLVVPSLPAIMREYGLGLPRWLSGKESACTRKRSLVGEDALEKEMATHSSILAWEIPWVEEPGRLQSMGSQRVGHD